MKIKAISIANVKRVKDVGITPENSIVIIGGKNKMGKSSVLDCITYALMGKRGICPDPIHHGADSAEIILQLEGENPIIITRTFKGDKSYLEVTTVGGAPIRSPQKMLDALFDAFIDPLAFEKAEAKDQLAIIRGLTGLDFTELDESRDAAYTSRTEVNRKIKTGESRLQRMIYHGAVYAEPVDVHGMLDLRKDMEAEKEVIQDARNNLAAMRANQDTAENRIEEITKEVDALLSERKNQEECRERYTKDIITVQERLEAETVPDFTDIDAKIAGASDYNSKYEENQRYAAEQSELEQSRDDADAYTESITTLDQQKKDMVAGVKMPLDGLAFGDDGVTFNGVVFEQCSQAEKLQVSSAIGLALNPELRVLLIRDGSLLDEDSMELMAEIAEQNDAQIWIERVGDADENAIIIEDGMVKQ